jgi:succinate dehydrogenase hydrophobic anchor subunit
VWIQNFFTRLVFFILAAFALYHAGYGLFSIAADYTSSGKIRAGVTVLIIVLIAVLAVSAFRLILSV